MSDIRYEVTLILTLNAPSQHEAAEFADELVEFLEDAGDLLPPGDSSIRIKSISWPVA